MVSASTGNAYSAATAPAVDSIVAPRTPSDPADRPDLTADSLRLEIHRPAGDHVVVRLGGDVDQRCLPRLSELIEQRLAAAALQTITLDCSRVDFFSIRAFEWLLRVRQYARLRGISLELITDSSERYSLDRLLEVTRTREIFAASR